MTSEQIARVYKMDEAVLDVIAANLRFGVGDRVRHVVHGWTGIVQDPVSSKGTVMCWMQDSFQVGCDPRNLENRNDK